jgi:hypothetical protein
MWPAALKKVASRRIFDVPVYFRRLRRSPPPESVVSMIFFGGSCTAAERLGEGAVLCGIAMASTKCC